MNKDQAIAAMTASSGETLGEFDSHDWAEAVEDIAAIVAALWGKVDEGFLATLLHIGSMAAQQAENTL